MFQRAFAAEPRAFCADCHGPVRAAREHGIGCVACHGERAHDAPAVACASCHELAFPSDARVHLARRFRVVREGDAARKELASDDRVCDATRTVDLDLDLGPLARGRAIAWRVAYQRVESPGGDTDAAVVADEIEISAGVAPAALLQAPVE